jgi:penicillin-binding protein 1A
MTLTAAFAESRNVPAVKLAASVGIRKVIETAHRFGVTSDIPVYLPVALGAAEITLEQQVTSYSVFPNDGIRVAPRLIRKVENYEGITLWQDRPEISEVVSQQTARAMMTLFRAVTAHGTGAAVAQMNHPLGGKTGTTSDFTDAWFIGFSPTVTCGVWVGNDNRESLGDKETGARAALPLWMTFMRAAIAGKDDEQFLGDSEELDHAAATTRPDAVAQAQPAEAPPQHARPAMLPARMPMTTRPRTGGSTASPLPRR